MARKRVNKRVSKNGKKCFLGTCDREADAGELCHRCDMRIRTQMKRGLAWIIARQQTISVWAEGLAMISGSENVVVAAERRAKQAQRKSPLRVVSKKTGRRKKAA